MKLIVTGKLFFLNIIEIKRLQISIDQKNNFKKIIKKNEFFEVRKKNGGNI